MRLFGTSGIRGDAEKLFTNQFCFDLGRTFIQFLDTHQQTGPIAVGMDPRESSPRIKEAVLQGLALSGRALFDEGMVPVPAMNWVLKKANLAGTIAVTGSHVQKELNGLKFFAFDEEILKKHEVEITQIYQRIKEKVPYQKRAIEVTAEEKASRLYEKMLLDLSNGDFPDWKVVVDPGNGAQSIIIPRVLKNLGLKVKAINTEPTADRFMARDTESSEVFSQVASLIKKEKADLGIIFDADGDRVVFVDEKGQSIPGDYSCSLIARESEGKQIVTPINTSQVVNHLGKKVIRTKVGSPYVVKAMKDNRIDFGFESNGGGISAEIMMSRDGGSTTIKLLKILRQSGKPLSQLIAELPRFYIVKDKIDCPWKFNPLIFKEVKKKYQGKKIEDLDGLKIWLEKTSWILFRPSSNAPEFRVFAEAQSQVRATKLVQDGLKFVKEIIS